MSFASMNGGDFSWNLDKVGAILRIFSSRLGLPVDEFTRSAYRQ